MAGLFFLVIADFGICAIFKSETFLDGQMTKKKVNHLTRKEYALIAKRLGVSYAISLRAFLKKLERIVDDKALPQSVKDAAQREIDKFDLTRLEL